MNEWGYALMTVGMVLFWGLVTFGVIALVRYLGRGNGSVGARRSAARVRAERYARGEIDEQEHRERSDTPEALGKPGRRR